MSAYRNKGFLGHPEDRELGEVRDRLLVKGDNRVGTNCRKYWNSLGGGVVLLGRGTMKGLRLRGAGLNRYISSFSSHGGERIETGG